MNRKRLTVGVCLAMGLMLLWSSLVAQSRTPKTAGNWHKFGQNISAGWHEADKKRMKGDYEKAAEFYEKVAEYIKGEEVGRIPHQVVCESMAELCRAMPVDVKTIKDGVYSGKSTGYAGGVTVAVKVAKGKIAAVAVSEHKESRPRDALKLVPALIARKESPSVDAATGATVTSYAVMHGSFKALQSAPKAEADDATDTKKDAEKAPRDPAED